MFIKDLYEYFLFFIVVEKYENSCSFIKTKKKEHI